VELRTDIFAADGRRVVRGARIPLSRIALFFRGAISDRAIRRTVARVLHNAAPRLKAATR
jgi:hypothetical protein